VVLLWKPQTHIVSLLKNLRAIFDAPPSIYNNFRQNEPDGGKALENAALHVVVMDEFDSIARSRGGSDGKGGQGDAGVARDSVVNQLLAKMDGVQPLRVPTLVSHTFLSDFDPTRTTSSQTFFLPCCESGHWAHQQEKSDRTR
jgi:hypothetical protein